MGAVKYMLWGGTRMDGQSSAGKCGGNVSHHGSRPKLLKLMLELLGPNRGTVAVFGQPPRKVSRHIGYVPQNVHFNKDFQVSVLDIFLMGCLWTGRGWSWYN